MRACTVVAAGATCKNMIMGRFRFAAAPLLGLMSSNPFVIWTLLAGAAIAIFVSGRGSGRWRPR